MKKTAITMEQIKFKQDQIKKLLADTLTKIHAVITPAASVNQISAQVGTMLNAMSVQINQIVLEMVSLNLALQQQIANSQQQPAAADDGNMGMGSGNYDYGTSPYMRMDEMQTITHKKLSKR